MHSLLALTLGFCMLTASAQEYYLFAGTYTSGTSKGIYVYRFNSQSGSITPVSHTDSCSNPSFLAIAPGGKFLYAVNETGRDKPGRVSAFQFNKTSGKLSLLNQQLSGGDDPCFVSIGAGGKWVVVGNYSGGSLSAFPVQADGSLAAFSQLIQHTGSSANKQRQEKAHVHSTFFSPDDQYVLVPDLGMDKVMSYRFNATARQPLSPALPPFTATQPGSGPRHLAFHPNGKIAYLLEEMSGAVQVFTYHNGTLQPLQRIAAHSSDYTGQPGSADIHVSPDGKFLYASNRGDENNIAIFAIATDGRLTAKGYQPVMGAQPRNFIIDPSGKFVLVANQKTNQVVVFKRNAATGQLTHLPKNTIDVPMPVCLVLLAR